PAWDGDTERPPLPPTLRPTPRPMKAFRPTGVYRPRASSSNQNGSEQRRLELLTYSPTSCLATHGAAALASRLDPAAGPVVGDLEVLADHHAAARAVAPPALRPPRGGRRGPAPHGDAGPGAAGGRGRAPLVVGRGHP